MKYLKIIIYLSVFILALGAGLFWQVRAAHAADYYAEGVLLSTDLLAGVSDEAWITGFTATSSVPANTTVGFLFSVDGNKWYSHDGIQGGWDTMADGVKTFDLSNLNWATSTLGVSSLTFYYKAHLTTTDKTVTPAVYEVAVNYSNTYNPAVGQYGYYKQGTLVSTDLVAAADPVPIDRFGYNLSSLPANTFASVQFATTTDYWYSAAGTAYASTTLAVGDHLSQASAIDLSTGLNWSSKNFYYKIIFSTGDNSQTPVLTEVVLNPSSAAAPSCGDGTCNGTETHITCPADCKASTQINTPLSGRFLDSSLVGYWSFDGANMGATTATDLSGNGNTGTLYGGVKKVPGINGQALSFDGADDYADRGTGPTAVNTVAFWVYPKTTTEYFINLTGTTVYIWANVGVLTATGFSGTPTIYVNGAASNTIVAGQWQYIAITTTVAENASNLDIGRTQDANYFGGKMDEVRIYSRVLSASEIAEQYRAGAGRMKVNTPTTLAGPTSGLVGNWSFNGQDISGATALDRSGQSPANNGTIYGAKPVIGKVGQALSFDGTSDYVEINHHSDFDLAANQGVAVSLWVKSDGDADGGQLFISANANDRFQCKVAATGIVNFGLLSGSDGHDSVGNTNIIDGRWHHIVCMRDTSGNPFVYVDGASDGTPNGTVAGAITNSENPRIGGRQNNDEFFDGLMDEVRIYNRALSADEIQQLYRLRGPLIIK